MAELNKSSFETKYNNSGTGLFRTGQSRGIGSDDTRVLVEDVKDSFINKLDELYKTFGVTASGTDTYTATADPAITTYTTDTRFYIKFTNANTGAATLNLNGLGANSIVKSGATALASGDISAGQILELIYDGTNFQIVGGGGGGGGNFIASDGNTTLLDDIVIDGDNYTHGITFTNLLEFDVQTAGSINIASESTWRIGSIDNASVIDSDGFNTTIYGTEVIFGFPGTIAVYSGSTGRLNVETGSDPSVNTYKIRAGALSDQLELGSARTVIITAPTPATASRTWTIPDLSGDMTFVGLTGVQTLTNKTLTSPIINYGSDAAGDLYRRNAGNTSQERIAAGTNGHVLTMVTGVPQWAAASSGFADPMTTRGDVIIRNASNVTARLGVGTVGQVLTSDGTDISWAAAAGGGSLSGLTAATGTNTINNADHAQEWQWNTLGAGTGLTLSSSSTAAASNTQTVLRVNQTGANATSTQTTHAGYFSNTKTGTSSTNVGIYASATGGTNNRAIWANAAAGQYGFYQTIITGDTRANVGGLEIVSTSSTATTTVTPSRRFQVSINPANTFGFRVNMTTNTLQQPGLVWLDGTWNPSSGANNFTVQRFTNTINQTGTASGTVIGIHYAPTLTSILGTHLSFWAESGNMLVPASSYHNYGTTSGTTGYGFRDNAGTMEFKDSGGNWISHNGVMTAASYTSGRNIINTSDTAEVQYNFLWVANSAASGNNDLIGTSLMPNDSVLTCEIHGQGVAADGSEGISVVKVLSMRRDGAGTPVVMGSESSLHSAEDSGNTPTIVLSVSSGDLRVSFDSNSATVYHWTIFAKISITKV